MGQKAFIPQEYDVFAGLDVDKKSISVTFSNPSARIRAIVAYAVQCGALAQARAQAFSRAEGCVRI